jgi:hypothetical protein
VILGSFASCAGWPVPPNQSIDLAAQNLGYDAAPKNAVRTEKAFQKVSVKPFLPPRPSTPMADHPVTDGRREHRQPSNVNVGKKRPSVKQISETEETLLRSGLT